LFAFAASAAQAMTGNGSAAPALGPMPTHHTSTLLPSGRLLIAGGTEGGPALAIAALDGRVANTGSNPAHSMGTGRQSDAATMMTAGKGRVVGANSSAAISAASSTTLMSSVNPSYYGQSVTFTASVTGQSPTGTVAFKDGFSTITNCGAVALSAGSATCAISTLTPGGNGHGITAEYSGDLNNDGSTSSVLTQTVKVKSGTALMSSLNPSSYGQTVNLTATITGYGTMSGDVTFKDGTTQICNTPVSSGAFGQGLAACMTSSLTAGSHSITAEYSGDYYNFGSTSVALMQTVNKAAGTISFDSLSFTYDGTPKGVTAHIAEEPGTSCTVTGSPVGPNAGSYPVSVTNCAGTNYTASDNASAAIAKATGTIAFEALTFTYDGSSKAVTAHIVEDSIGCTVIGSPVGPNAGSYPVSVADCSGANYTASGDDTATIDKATSSVTLASPCMRTFVEGQPYTLDTAVSGAHESDSVTFNDGHGGTLCGSSVALDGSGMASCTSSALEAAGSPYSITVYFGGDTNYKPATSNGLVLTVLGSADVIFRNAFDTPNLSCPVE
jgi:hypothetical protein